MMKKYHRPLLNETGVWTVPTKIFVLDEDGMNTFNKNNNLARVKFFQNI